MMIRRTLSSQIKSALTRASLPVRHSHTIDLRYEIDDYEFWSEMHDKWHTHLVAG